MKKLLLALLILPVLALSACSKKVQSVDLSQITFDGVSVGNAFAQIETDHYTISDRYPEQENTYNYEEWRVSVDHEIITKITASFETIAISVNGKKDCHSIEEIIQTLGEEYHSSWYDKEQKLMQIQYADQENQLQCAFIYDKNSNQLVWGIMQAFV